MIYNLTQHKPTPEQIEAGVGQPIEGASALLTFDTYDQAVNEVTDRATQLVALLHGAGAPAGSRVMIGGAPFLMPYLASCLREQDFVPTYAFSVRESVDQPQSDGSVKKVAVFKHVGFLPA